MCTIYSVDSQGESVCGRAVRCERCGASGAVTAPGQVKDKVGRQRASGSHISGGQKSPLVENFGGGGATPKDSLQPTEKE